MRYAAKIVAKRQEAEPDGSLKTTITLGPNPTSARVVGVEPGVQPDPVLPVQLSFSTTTDDFEYAKVGEAWVVEVGRDWLAEAPEPVSVAPAPPGAAEPEF